MSNNSNLNPSSGNKLKFVIFSIIGVFLFMIPIPDGDGAFNIPLGYAINWLGLTLNSIVINDLGFLALLAAIFITISTIGSILAYTVKPAFIMNNERIKNLFLCHPVYFVSKIIALIFVWMVYLSVGPTFIIGEEPWLRGQLMLDLIAGGSSGSNLLSIFLILGITIPLLTDFGLMEFLGILIRKVIRGLFTLPGRSSIDLLGSWFSSSAASVLITTDQHEKGYYTGREAAAICVNFTLVSLPFTFVVANTIGIAEHFGLFYLVICVTTIILAIIMPRIPPLSMIKDEYLPGVGKQIDEDDIPANVSRLEYATKLASEKASKATAGGVIKSGMMNWLNIFMDLIPVIMAWGTLALIIEDETDIFATLGAPFAWMLNALGVEGALDAASATVVGFIDMFIPAFMLGDAPFPAQFVIGALSIIQIIYMAETGILILKSKIPLNIIHLLILFVMRTILAIPIVVLLFNILY